MSAPNVLFLPRVIDTTMASFFFFFPLTEALTGHNFQVPSTRAAGRDVFIMMLRRNPFVYPHGNNVSRSGDGDKRAAREKLLHVSDFKLLGNFHTDE